MNLECFPAAIVHRAFELAGDDGGNAVIQPVFAHFFPPGVVQVLPASSPVSDNHKL